MSSSTGHGRASSSQARDNTYTIQLPGSWEAYETSPVDTTVNYPPIPQFTRAVPDHEGLIPVQRADEGQTHLETLAEIGFDFLRTVEIVPGAHASPPTLSTQVALFEHFRDPRKPISREGMTRPVINLFQDLAINPELLHLQPSRDWSHDGHRRTYLKCNISNQTHLKIVLPNYTVIEVFSRLHDLFEARTKSDPPTSENKVIEFLQLYFIDVFNDLPGLPAFHTSWKQSEWHELDTRFALIDEYQKAVIFIRSFDGERAKNEAIKAEGWIRTRMSEYLRSKGRSFNNADIPLGEIAFRIMRVWTNFRNTLIHVWQAKNDPRRRDMLLWGLQSLQPQSSHSQSHRALSKAPIPQHARTTREETLWEYGRQSLHRATHDSPAGKVLEIPSDLTSQVMMLVHLNETTRLSGILDPSAAFVAKHLVLDSLLLHVDNSGLWPRDSDLNYPSIRLAGKRTAVFDLPSFAVARVILRLNLIAGEARRYGGVVDQERQWVQWLQLFLIDVIDSCEQLGTFHTRWDLATWRDLMKRFGHFAPLNTAVNAVASFDQGSLEGVAQEVEKWVRTSLRDVGDASHLHALLPPGEISNRIVRVCAKFRNMAVQVWTFKQSDPRYRDLQQWKIPLPPPKSHGVRPDPEEAIAAAGRRFSLLTTFDPSHTPGRAAVHDRPPAPRLPTLQDRRRSLPLSSVYPPPSGHTPIPRHPRRQSLAFDSASPPHSPSAPPRVYTEPLPQPARSTRPSSPLPVIHSIGGPANSTPIPIEDRYKPKRRGMRDTVKGWMKGKKRDDARGDGDRRELD